MQHVLSRAFSAPLLVYDANPGRWPGLLHYAPLAPLTSDFWLLEVRATFRGHEAHKDVPPPK